MDIDQIGDKIRRILIEKTNRATIKGGKIWICCPFHYENTPSCSVTLHDIKYAPGTFFCFGCSASGGWNKLATKFGFKFRIDSKEINTLMKTNIHYNELSNGVEFTDVGEFLQHNQKIESYTKWPKGKTWRKVGYQFLKDVDSYMLLSPDYNKTSDDVKYEQLLFLPVKVNGVIVGGISAPLDRKRYMNTEGDWVKNRGLFPFDTTKQLLKSFAKKFVVLVEGPRDAARLIQANIPALAILGSKNWTVSKRDLLMTLTGDDLEIVLLFDSDLAGQSASLAVKNTCKNIFDTIKVKLPEYTVEDGENVKCDVFNLDERRFCNLVSKLKRRYQ